MFKQSDYESVNIAEMKRVLAITSITEDLISIQHYQVNSGKKINETDVANKSLSFTETGPSFNLMLRRDKQADSDLYKTACKQPKMSAEAKRLKKNLFTDEFGQQKGKVFLQQQ